MNTLRAGAALSSNDTVQTLRHQTCLLNALLSDATRLNQASKPTVSGINDREGGAQEPEGLGVAHAIEAAASWILSHPSLCCHYTIHHFAGSYCSKSGGTNLHRVCLENMRKGISANPWSTETTNTMALVNLLCIHVMLNFIISFLELHSKASPHVFDCLCTAVSAHS